MLKYLIRRIFPEKYREFADSWNKLKNKIKLAMRRIFKPESDMRFVIRRIARRHGWVVQSGPFAGMRYEEAGAKIPRLLGSYESELHDVIEHIIATSYPVIVNIGADEGYYAVGFAYRMPDVQVLAFEMSPRRQECLVKRAADNGLADRITVYGECDVDRLKAVLPEQALIFCDCEGCEGDVLRPDLIPNLRTCDLLVELHDHKAPNVTEAILSRFSETHDIEMIKPTGRDPADYPALRPFSSAVQQHVLRERRGVTPWAIMVSKMAGSIGSAKR